MSFKMGGFHDNMKQMTFEKGGDQIHHHNTMLNTSKEKMQSEKPNYESFLASMILLYEFLQFGHDPQQ